MTTTAEHTETIPGPSLNPEPAQNLPAAPVAVPSEIGQFSLAVRRMLGLEDASDGEIELFFHVCHKSGLDPFNKEVYMIGRNTQVAEWVSVDPSDPNSARRKEVRWVTKYTIQTGINGFRKRAREIAEQKGAEFRQDDPLWCGEDGVWKEVWPDKKPPVAAKFVVYRDGHRYSFIAHYAEYVQTDRDGKPNSMWSKMPCNQTRKCAEAGALQAAFPDELGGLLLEDAVQNEPVVIDEDGEVQQPAAKPRTKRGGRGVSSLRDAARATAVPAETTVVTEEGNPVGAGDTAVADTRVENTTAGADRAEPDEQESQKDGMRKAVENRLFKMTSTLHEQVGGDRLSRDERIALYRTVLKRDDITSTNDLDNVEVSAVADQLFRWAQAGKLADEIAEIRNAVAIDAAAAADTEKAGE
jgi:phage recombination protein Bet